MTENVKKGDLIWIPQHARLHWLREDSDKRYLITNVPRAAVVCEEKDKSYDVFMDGNLWTINKTCTYYLEEQHAS